MIPVHLAGFLLKAKSKPSWRKQGDYMQTKEKRKRVEPNNKPDPAVPLKYPEQWDKLPPKQLEVIKQLVLLHRKYNRWPTYPEIAQALGETTPSVVHSIEQLIKHRYITQTGGGKRGVPPRFDVHGFKVMILLDD